MSEYGGDGEPVDVSTEIRLRARVLHKCSACAEPIAPGHEYVKQTTIWDGNVEVVKRCLRCQVMYEHLNEIEQDRDMYIAPRLDCGHDYKERHDAEPPPEIAALAFMTPEEKLTLKPKVESIAERRRRYREHA